MSPPISAVNQPLPLTPPTMDAANMSVLPAMKKIWGKNTSYFIIIIEIFSHKRFGGNEKSKPACSSPASAFTSERKRLRERRLGSSQTLLHHQRSYKEFARSFSGMRQREIIPLLRNGGMRTLSRGSSCRDKLGPRQCEPAQGRRNNWVSE